jgi:hypothetical protein
MGFQIRCDIDSIPLPPFVREMDREISRAMAALQGIPIPDEIAIESEESNTLQENSNTVPDDLPMASECPEDDDSLAFIELLAQEFSRPVQERWNRGLTEEILARAEQLIVQQNARNGY